MLDYKFLREYAESEVKRLSKVLALANENLEFYQTQYDAGLKYGKEKMRLEAGDKIKEVRIKIETVEPKVMKLAELIKELDNPN